jgi:hypothetical protein
MRFVNIDTRLNENAVIAIRDIRLPSSTLLATFNRIRLQVIWAATRFVWTTRNFGDVSTLHKQLSRRNLQDYRYKLYFTSNKNPCTSRYKVSLLFNFEQSYYLNHSYEQRNGLNHLKTSNDSNLNNRTTSCIKVEFNYRPLLQALWKIATWVGPKLQNSASNDRIWPSPASLLRLYQWKQEKILRIHWSMHFYTQRSKLGSNRRYW